MRSAVWGVPSTWTLVTLCVVHSSLGGDSPEDYTDKGVVFKIVPFVQIQRPGDLLEVGLSE